MIRSLRELQDLRGKRVVIRSDFNVDVDASGHIIDRTRIERALPTYRYLIDRGAIVIALTHLGRPEGKIDPALSTKPIAEELSQLLALPVTHIEATIGERVAKTLQGAKPGSVYLLENVRFAKEEQENDPVFAKQLAELGEIFIADEFGVAHRDDASTTGIAKILPTYAGLLMEEEMKNLDVFRENPPRPSVLVIGGAKLVDKIKLIRASLNHADHILIGGALFATFFAAAERPVGASKVEDEVMQDALATLHESLRSPHKIVLPVDVVVASGVDQPARIKNITEIEKNDIIYDIGPRTIELFQAVISQAKSLVLNGAMGLFEKPAFSHGTETVFRAVADSEAYTIAGGGETIMALNQWKLAPKINFISTGGGAMLSYLDGSPMPGITIIPNS